MSRDSRHSPSTMSYSDGATAVRGAAAAAAAARGGSCRDASRRTRGGEAEKSVQSVLSAPRLMSESCDWLAPVARPAIETHGPSDAKLRRASRQTCVRGGGSALTKWQWDGITHSACIWRAGMSDTTELDTTMGNQWHSSLRRFVQVIKLF